MKLLHTFIVVTGLLFYSLYTSAQQPDNYSGGAYELGNSVCLTDIQRTQIIKSLHDNVLSLDKLGLINNRSNHTIELTWPVEQASGFNDPDIYGISNYVDHDPQNTDDHNNWISDWNCGNRSYDVQGYNHSGIDIFTWPFSWTKMDDGQVDIVAAAPGVIIGKDDGRPDRSCSFNVSTGWNAVYILHSDGSQAWYGHMEAFSLTDKDIGETVDRGEYLGKVGSSGISTGPHLHFEIYDSNGNLNDPYEGPCNQLNARGWWSQQPEYREPAINKIMTHIDPPQFYNCDPADINAQDIFNNEDRIYFAAYFRDQLEGSETLYRIYTPDQSLFSNWSHISPLNYNASYWNWSFNFDFAPNQIPLLEGIWTFEAEYNGQIVQHNFEFIDVCNGFTVSHNLSHTSCGEENGSLSIDIQGGHPPYEINLNNEVVDSSNLENLSSGLYRYIIIDEMGCEANASVIVRGSNPLSLDIEDQSYCDQDSIIINPNLEDGMDYLWSDGTTDNSFHVPASGMYSLIITDEDNCMATDTFVVNVEYTPEPLFDYEINGDREVIFTNLTDGSNIDVLWDFGDGSTSSEFSPTHSFGFSAVYTVCLVVEACGVKSHCIEVDYASLTTSDPKDQADLSIYPNPASEYINYNLSTGSYSMEGKIEIRDNSGRVISQMENLRNSNFIQVGNLSNAIYWLTYSDSEGFIVAKRFVVIR